MGYFGRIAVVLSLVAMITFIVLAQETTPLWAFAAVTCLWAVCGWSAWQTSKNERQGLHEKFQEARLRGEEAIRDEAKRQVKPRFKALGWAILMAATATGAFALTVHVTS